MKLQGADKHALKERGNDFYQTPECATLALMRNLELPDVIWEPCAGMGAISRVLMASDRAVIATDLVKHEGADSYIGHGIDFLMETKAPAKMIVTNPPYKLADKFIRHGLALGCDVIVLLRLMAIEGRARSDIMDNYLYQIYAGIERLPMMHREGWEGNKTASSGAPFAWFRFCPEQRFKHQPIELYRISWRDG